jgi:hypothetical protein
MAVALANWTDQVQKVTLHDARLGKQVTVTTIARQQSRQSAVLRRGSLSIELPPLSVVLVEQNVSSQ